MSFDELIDDAGLILSLHPHDLLVLSVTSPHLHDALSTGSTDKAWLTQCRHRLPS
jgi:hypothetical protein